MSVRGIAVSDSQRRIDWPSVANSDIAYAVTQATEGATEVADTFSANWQGIKAAGLVRGACHVFRPEADAQAQADCFLNTVLLETGDLPPVLSLPLVQGVDLEALTTALHTWLSLVERETERPPILYTSLHFWDAIASAKSFTNFPLWIVDNTLTSRPKLPEAWEDWTLWQYSDGSRVPGVTTAVKVSWFNSIYEGTNGTRVQEMQKRLQERGFDPGAMDGTFSLLTHAAVMDFQRSLYQPEDGVVGLQTWTYLMAPIAATRPAETSLTTASESILLTNVAQYYQGVPAQTQALDWLQNQLSQETLLEFANQWRNDTSASDRPIRMVNAAVYYQGSAHQTQALKWLQDQMSPETLAEFTRQWRSAPPPTIALVDVARYYRGIPAQAEALKWLQSQLSAAQIQEFARQWRNQPTASARPIRLIDAAVYYKGSAYQTQALRWLQRQLSGVTLEEFARRWRSAPPLPMRLVNVPEYYQDAPHQISALNWLQTQISSNIFEGFAQKWRG